MDGGHVQIWKIVITIHYFQPIYNRVHVVVVDVVNVFDWWMVRWRIESGVLLGKDPRHPNHEEEEDDVVVVVMVVVTFCAIHLNQ